MLNSRRLLRGVLGQFLRVLLHLPKYSLSLVVVVVVVVGNGLAAAAPVKLFL
jgi:hypothetical protein